MSNRPRVVIIGGGFAGLHAAQGLARAAVDITLLDKANHHCFQPLLYQVATAGLAGPQIASPIRHVLRRQTNVSVQLAEAARILPADKQLLTRDGRILAWDYLVVATGATHAYFGHDDWADHAPGLKTLGDALDIRRRVLLAFERAELEDDEARRAALTTFVVVGAGPTGVELAGALAEIARLTLADEFRRLDPRKARVVLVEAGPRVLSTFHEESSAAAVRQLERIGVELRLGTPVTHIDGTGVRLGEEHLPACTVLWAAGVAASPLAASLGAPLDRAGRVLVEPDASVPGHPDIFVVGDLAHLEQDGRPVPGVAPAAIQGGQHVARAIRSRLAGKTPAPFHYRDKGSLATIGRSAAVAEIGGRRFSGFIAWLLWALVHLMVLIGFRNRLVTLMDWTWSYISFGRGARVLLERPVDHSPPEP